MNRLILLRNPEDYRLISKEDRKDALILPLSPETEEWVTEKNLSHFTLSSLIPGRNWEKWQWRIHEEIEDGLKKTKNFPLKVQHFRMVKACQAFRQSYELAKLIIQSKDFNKCIAVTGPPEPVWESSLRDKARDNQLEWTIMSVLKDHGVSIHHILPEKHEKPWMEQGFFKRFLDEFRPLRWPALLIGLFSMIVDHLSASLFRKSRNFDVMLVSGVEMSTAEKESRMIRRDKPVKVLVSSIGQEGDRILPKTKLLIRHIALLRLLYGKTRKQNREKLIRQISHAITDIVGTETAESNPEWLQLQSEDVADYHMFLHKTFIQPFLSWLSHVKLERVFFTSPFNPVNRWIALEAGDMGVRTICLPHGGWYRKAYLGTYGIFDELGVWGEYMKNELMKTGFDGNIFIQTREIIDQGSESVPEQMEENDFPRLLLISSLLQIIKPTSIISITNFRRAVNIMVEAAKRLDAGLYVKCHPRYDNYSYYSMLENQDKLKALSLNASLDDALRNCDVVLTFTNFTTALVRAMELNVPVILVDTSGYEELLSDVTPSEYAYLVKNADELEKVVKSIIEAKNGEFTNRIIRKQKNFLEFYNSRKQ